MGVGCGAVGARKRGFTRSTSDNRAITSSKDANNMVVEHGYVTGGLAGVDQICSPPGFPTPKPERWHMYFVPFKYNPTGLDQSGPVHQHGDYPRGVVFHGYHD